MLTSYQYTQRKGFYCPVCQEYLEMEAQQIKVQDNLAFQQVNCQKCDSSWVDVFQLIGYDSLEQKEEE